MAPAARNTFVGPRRDASLACSTIAGFGNRGFTSREIISLTPYERTGVSTDFLGAGSFIFTGAAASTAILIALALRVLNCPSIAGFNSSLRVSRGGCSILSMGVAAAGACCATDATGTLFPLSQLWSSLRNSSETSRNRNPPTFPLTSVHINSAIPSS